MYVIKYAVIILKQNKYVTGKYILNLKSNLKKKTKHRISFCHYYICQVNLEPFLLHPLSSSGLMLCIVLCFCNVWNLSFNLLLAAIFNFIQVLTGKHTSIKLRYFHTQNFYITAFIVRIATTKFSVKGRHFNIDDFNVWNWIAP